MLLSFEDRLPLTVNIQTSPEAEQYDSLGDKIDKQAEAEVVPSSS